MALVTMIMIPLTCDAQLAVGSDEHWRWGSTPDAEERAAIIETVAKSVKARNFAGLDALELEYRNSILPSGSSKLPIFFEEITYLLGGTPNTGECSDAGWIDYIDDWEARSPGAPGPVIARASLLDGLAWCYRGNGFAASVSANGWRDFHRTISKAVDILDSKASVAAVDPHYYKMLEDLAVDNGMPPDGFKKLLLKGSARFPYYYDLYYAAFRYYLPQWNGGVTEMDDLARFAASRTKARDGAGAYFRVYWHRVTCNCVKDLYAIDWQTARVAMADLAKRYPTDWTYLHLVQMSCLHGDANEARKYFGRLTINQAGAWTEDSWMHCRALVGPSDQPFPEALQ